MKEHDRTTTKRIQDNRLRVSLLKNTEILIPVHIISQEVFPQLLLVSQNMGTIQNVRPYGSENKERHQQSIRLSMSFGLSWSKKLRKKWS